MSKIEKKRILQISAKVGVVKQLHKDHLITDDQYQLLMRKYSHK